MISDFLKNTLYSPNYFINTKGRNDLVIHNSKGPDSSVGVIVEAKKPTNKTEMLSVENINCKGFHELILYYLRERILGGNIEIKHLIATNTNEWFVFDRRRTTYPSVQTASTNEPSKAAVHQRQQHIGQEVLYRASSCNWFGGNEKGNKEVNRSKTRIKTGIRLDT